MMLWVKCVDLATCYCISYVAKTFPGITPNVLYLSSFRRVSTIFTSIILYFMYSDPCDCQHLNSPLFLDHELALFDKYSSSLTSWCEQQGRGVTSLPAVGTYIAISSNHNRESAGSGWTRAVVTRHVDSDRYILYNYVHSITHNHSWLCSGSCIHLLFYL